MGNCRTLKPMISGYALKCSMKGEFPEMFVPTERPDDVQNIVNVLRSIFEDKASKDV